MRARVVAVLLIVSGGLVVLPPTGEAAAPTAFDGMFCGRANILESDIFRDNGNSYAEYCIFQALEGSPGGVCRDTFYREAPADSPAARAVPPCDPATLEVSGESQWEFDDSREWTRMAILRFPDWRSRLTEKFGPNLSIRWSFVQVYYDDDYYASHVEARAAKNEDLFLTEIKVPPDGRSWQSIADTPGGFLNWTTENPSRGWIQDGDPFNGRGPPITPTCGSGTNMFCRVWITDWSAFVTGSFSNRQNLNEVIHNRRPWDQGFAIAHADLFSESADPTGRQDDAIQDRGTCADPTHPQFPEEGAPVYPRYQDIPPAESTCLHIFRSASWPGTGAATPRPECVDRWVNGIPGLEGESTWVCWPRLVVHFDRNEPVVERAQILYNRTRSDLGAPAFRSFAGNVPVNLSLDLRDDRGRVRSVTYSVETSENGVGRTILRDVPVTGRKANTTLTAYQQQLCQCERWQYWTQAPLNLPSGRYWINFTVEDNDGNRVLYPPPPACKDSLDNDADGPVDMADSGCTGPTDNHEAPGFQAPPGPNLLVDDRPPGITAIAVDPAEFDHKGLLGFRATIRSPFPDQRIENVWGEVRAATSDGTPGALLKRFKAQPGTVDSFLQGTWTGGGSWGQFDPRSEPPGTFHLWIRANDTLGRENFTFGASFRVRDTLDPRLDLVRILTPQAGGARVHIQEVGGPVRFEVDAHDPENPTAPAVRVRLESAGKDPVEANAPALSGGRTVLTLPAPSEGTWSGRVFARDAEGRQAVETFTLITIEPAAPILRGPIPSTWANLTPRVAVEVFDLTANASRVRLYAGEPGLLTEKAALITGTAPLLTVTAPSLGTLRHNRTIQVRVEAEDDLGNNATLVWNFTVDAVPPAPTQLSVGVPSETRAGRTYLRGATALALTAGDTASGIGQIHYRVTDLRRNLTGAWTEYGGAFTLAGADVFRDPGAYKVEWRATDRAGNRETARERTFEVDSAAPTLRINYDGLAFTVEATDPGSGLAQVQIWHRNATEPGWNLLEVRLPDVATVKDTLTIPAVPRGARSYYHALARDRVGNEVLVASRTSPLEVISPNHAPRLVAHLPDNATDIAGIVAIPYEARDPDGDAVRVVLQIRPLILPEVKTLATVGGTAGTLAWNTSAHPDGTYQITVLASDESATAVAQTTVDVRNTATGAFRPTAPFGRVEFTEPVTFAVTLFKPVREAKVTIRGGDGALVATVPLRDDGKNGDAVAGDRIFSATYVAPGKGTFGAQLEVAYENEPAAQHDLGTFTVESTLTKALVRNALPIGLGTLVALGVAAAVLVQLTRYGYLFVKE